MCIPVCMGDNQPTTLIIMLWRAAQISLLRWRVRAKEWVGEGG